MTSLCYPFFWHLEVQTYFISNVNLLDPEDSIIQWKLGHMLFHWAGSSWVKQRCQSLLQEHVWNLALWTDGNSEWGNYGFLPWSAIGMLCDLGQITCSHVSCFHLLFSKHLRMQMFYIRDSGIGFDKNFVVISYSRERDHLKTRSFTIIIK